MDTPQKETDITAWDFVPREIVPLEIVRMLDVRSPASEVSTNG